MYLYINCLFCLYINWIKIHAGVHIFSVFACVQVCIRRAVYMNCLFCLYINWIKNWIKIHVGVCICFSVCVSASMYKRGCVVSPLFTVSKISICICMDRGGRGWSTESGQAWTKGGGGGGGSKKKKLCGHPLWMASNKKIFSWNF